MLTGGGENPENAAIARGPPITPMMEQYIEIKAANPDCLLFYRMGDFYELFFDDAEIAARALGIVLTKRGKHLGRDIPMCGVPVERADEYLHRLIALGHRVAVCEQLEDPAEARKRGNKSVVRRDVVRLVTPGTLTEDSLLDARRNNYLVALARSRASSTDDRFALAWIDISTGEFRVAECDRAALSAEIARLEPGEMIVSDALYADAELAPVLRALPAVTPLTRDVFDGATAERGLPHSSASPPPRPSARSRVSSSPRRPRRSPMSSAPRSASARRCRRRCARRRRDARDRPGDARQSRAHAHPYRRAARLAARRDRPHGDGGRFAGPGAAARGAADRSARDRAAARRRRRVCRRHCAARRSARAAEIRCPISRAPSPRLVIGRGGPRDLAAIRDGIFAAHGIAERLSALAEAPRDTRRCGRGAPPARCRARRRTGAGARRRASGLSSRRRLRSRGL